MNLKVDIKKKVWFLEMLSIGEFKRKKLPPNTLVVKQGIPLAVLNRFFYKEVGEQWYWTDRKEWGIKKWEDWVDCKELNTWMLLFKGTPAGYFELNTKNKDVEIAHFGLLPIFIGKGLGGGFLSVAIEKAWELKIKRIWVHTSSFDHPNALKNYLHRGFKIYDEKN